MSISIWRAAAVSAAALCGCAGEPPALPEADALRPLIESASTLDAAAAAASLGDAEVRRELDDLVTKLAAETAWTDEYKRSMLLARALLLHEKHRDYPDASGHFQAGYRLERRNFAPEAYHQYAKAAERAPDDARNHAALGRTALRDGRPGDALAHYEHALELSPGSAAWTVEYGLCHYELKDDPAALAAFEKALTLDPGYRPTYERLAVVHWRMGAYDEAEAFLGTFREMGGVPPEGFAEQLAKDAKAALHESP